MMLLYRTYGHYCFFQKSRDVFQVKVKVGNQSNDKHGYEAINSFYLLICLFLDTNAGRDATSVAI